MNSLFANIINERKRLFGLCGQTLVVPVRGCGGISAPKSRNNGKHKVGKANNFKFGDIGATFPMLCLKTRRYLVLTCSALILVRPLGGVRIALVAIVRVLIGPLACGFELVDCHYDRLGLRLSSLTLARHQQKPNRPCAYRFSGNVCTNAVGRLFP